MINYNVEQLIQYNSRLLQQYSCQKHNQSRSKSSKQRSRFNSSSTRSVAPISRTRLTVTTPSQASSWQIVVSSVTVMEPDGAGVEREHGRNASDDSACSEDTDSSSEVGSTDKQVHEEQEKERSGEWDRAAECAEEEHEGDDHPHHKVDPECASEMRARVRAKTAGTGPVQDSVRDPETSEHREGGRAKGVPMHKLPHPSKELAEPTHGECHTNHSVHFGNMTSPGVEERPHQGRGGKRKQPKGAGVRDATVVILGHPRLGVAAEHSRASISLSVLSAMATVAGSSGVGISTTYTVARVVASAVHADWVSVVCNGRGHFVDRNRVRE